MITLITATGNRPEAFALCEKYMARQTYKGPKQWIVVDDCKPETKCTMKQDYYRGPKEWKPDINTQRLNLDSITPHIQGQFIFIIEDDDYYGPTYIDTHLALLRHADVVGEARSKYFSLRVPGWKIMPNLKHSSLAQTSFTKKALPLFEKAVNSGHFYIDVEFWNQAHAQSIPTLLVANKTLCVGIKGMPGREGITGSHRSKDFMYDAKLSILKDWIGGDYVNYINFSKTKDLIWEQKKNVTPKTVVTSTTLNRQKQVLSVSK